MDISAKADITIKAIEEAKRKRLFQSQSKQEDIFSQIVHTVILEAYIEGYRDNHRDAGSKKNDRFWKGMGKRYEIR